MEKVITVAGFLLAKAIDELDRTKKLNPVIIFCDGKSEVKYCPNGLSLEETIPKVMSAFEKNEDNKQQAVVVFPAELGEEKESAIILMAQDYNKNEYIMITQPYSFKNSQLIVNKFELSDYSFSLLDKLPQLEESFAKGLLNYGDIAHIFKRD